MPPSTSTGERSASAIKQQRYRDRKKAAALLAASQQAQQQPQPEDLPSSTEHNLGQPSSAVRDGKKRKAAGSPASSTDSDERSTDDGRSSTSTSSTVYQSEGMRRMAARLAELGVDEHEIQRLAKGGPAEEVDPVPMPPARPLRKFPALMPPQLDFRRPDLSYARTGSAAAPCVFGGTPAALFAGLLNDALPLPRPDYFPSPPTPDSIGSPGSPPTSDLLRQALQLQLGSPPRFLGARELPTYTYQSPVSLEADGRPLDWKVSLFALHRTCHLQRNHPEQGYLHNNVVKQITSQAQLVIMQLLGPSERMDAFARSRRPATAAEEAELAGLDDPRLMYCRDKVSKLACLRAVKQGEVDLTELLAYYIESALLYTDPWDMTACSLPLEEYSRLPLSVKTWIFPAPPEASRPHRGASFREVILGLELPGWRRKETPEQWRWPGALARIDRIERRSRSEGESEGCFGGDGGAEAGGGGGGEAWLEIWQEAGVV